MVVPVSPMLGPKITLGDTYKSVHDPLTEGGTRRERGFVGSLLTMLIIRIIAVAIIPSVERAELSSSCVLLSSPHRVELLGGPRRVFNGVDDIPPIDNTVSVGLKETVVVRNGRIWSVNYVEHRG